MRSFSTFKVSTHYPLTTSYTCSCTNTQLTFILHITVTTRNVNMYNIENGGKGGTRRGHTFAGAGQFLIEKSNLRDSFLLRNLYIFVKVSYWEIYTSSWKFLIEKSNFRESFLLRNIIFGKVSFWEMWADLLILTKKVGRFVNSYEKSGPIW